MPESNYHISLEEDIKCLIEDFLEDKKPPKQVLVYLPKEFSARTKYHPYLFAFLYYCSKKPTEEITDRELPYVDYTKIADFLERIGICTKKQIGRQIEIYIRLGLLTDDLKNNRFLIPLSPDYMFTKIPKIEMKDMLIQYWRPTSYIFPLLVSLHNCFDYSEYVSHSPFILSKTSLFKNCGLSIAPTSEQKQEVKHALEYALKFPYLKVEFGSCQFEAPHGKINYLGMKIIDFSTGFPFPEENEPDVFEMVEEFVR